MVLLLLVRRLDDVERTCEGDLAVDDEQLAVVAQIGPLELPLVGLQRQHEVPLDAGRVQEPLRAAEAGVLQVAEVVEQHAHLHAAGTRIRERLEERPRRVVERQDVELDVDDALRRTDLLRHRVEGLLVVGPHARAVAADERHRAERAVELDERLEPGRPRRVLLHEVDALGGLEDVLVDLALLAPPTLGSRALPNSRKNRMPR